MVVEFETEINIETATQASYWTFIENLRRRLGVRHSHNRPTLAVQQEPPTRFFDLVIRTNNHSVRFRLRMDNLYLIGYQMEDGQWLEFDNNARQHLITEQGTDFLGFGGSYIELENAASIGRMQDVRVGLYNLVRAINQLATSTDGSERAHNLIVVIMMICESTRFIPISNHMLEYFIISTQIQSWIMTLVRSWGTFSAALLRADAYPEEPFMLRSNVVRIPSGNAGNVDREIRTLAEVAEILGILLGLCFSRSGPRRFPRMTYDEEEGQCFLGLPLLEVFSVRINNIDAEDPGQLYGTITIDNGLNTQYIYNRTSGNPESIKPGQNASLTGPSEPISAFGNVTIKLLLTDKDMLSPDDEIIHKDISWDASDIGNVYDKNISRTLASSTGSVTVNYAVLRNAVAAKVSVILQEGGESTTNVYGQVSAHYDKWDDPETTCLLFEKASDDYVDVRQGDKIPLLRSVVAVPLDHSLKVTTRLYDNDTFSGDDLIANGTVEFPVPVPDQMISESKDIQGEDGNYVTVRVTWTSNFY